MQEYLRKQMAGLLGASMNLEEDIVWKPACMLLLVLYQNEELQKPFDCAVVLRDLNLVDNPAKAEGI